MEQEDNSGIGVWNYQKLFKRIKMKDKMTNIIMNLKHSSYKEYSWGYIKKIFQEKNQEFFNVIK